MEFLPGLPANRNNIGAVMNFLKTGRHIRYEEKEGEIKWGFVARKKPFCGRRKRDEPEPDSKQGEVEVWILVWHEIPERFRTANSPEGHWFQHEIMEESFSFLNHSEFLRAFQAARHKIRRIKNSEICTECKKELRLAQAPENNLLCVACMIPKAMLLQPSV